MTKLTAHVVLALLAVAIVVCATVLLASGHGVPVELWGALTVVLGALAGVSVPSGGASGVSGEALALVGRLEAVAKGLFGGSSPPAPPTSSPAVKS